MKGSLINRGKDVWLLKFDIGKDIEGKRQQRYETFHGNKSKAQKKLTSILDEINNNERADESNLTVGEWCHEWLRDYVGPNTNIREKTKERYTELIKHHIQGCPVDKDEDNYSIGKRKLKDLRENHIEEHYNFLRSEGLKSRSKTKPSQSKGMSETTLAHVHTAFSKALTKAERTRTDNGKGSILKDNPMKYLEVKPKQRRTSATIKYLEPNEINALIATAFNYDSEMHVFINLAATTGARRGELLGLNHQDLDIERKELRINKAVNQTRRDGVVIGKTKNETSNRTLPLSDKIIEMLKAHKLKQQKSASTMGILLPADALFFPKYISNPTMPITPVNISKRFSTIARKAGFKGLKLHSLRHSNASILLNSNQTDPKTISQMLGHASPTITLNVYSHSFKGGRERAVNIISNALDAKTEKHLQ